MIGYLSEGNRGGVKKIDQTFARELCMLKREAKGNINIGLRQKGVVD